MFDHVAQPHVPKVHPEELDVLIVGAGLSGIGAACHLRRDRPQTTFLVLEARPALGGTWDLFRYPGVRSDSDMFTLGYSFRPWPEREAIAKGESIRQYIEDTAEEYGVSQRIRYGHRVVSASWDSGAARWTVVVEQVDTGDRINFVCRWLSACAGYYRYDQGHRPDFPGEETFAGEIVVPQAWPQDLDWADKRVAVIGSGATAITLVPNLAERAAAVTMVQRTPTYIVSQPTVDRFGELVQSVLPGKLGSRLVFWKNVLGNIFSYWLARKMPALVQRLMQRDIVSAVGPGISADVHFRPPYKPWDQRICVVPDGDLFTALRERRATIVTDKIAEFVPEGIMLQSGQLVEADIVVAATGLAMIPLGGIVFEVDGVRADLPDAVTYKGMMLSGFPNFNLVMGYTNNSWTLKADLVSKYVTRLLGHLDENGFDYVVPMAPEEYSSLPFVDLNSGYVARAIEAFPRQGDHSPWRLHQNYLRDLRLLRFDASRERSLRFGRITGLPSIRTVAELSNFGGSHNAKI